MPFPCRSAKSLNRVFPIWFTQCGLVWFTHTISAEERHGMCESALSRRNYWPWSDAPLAAERRVMKIQAQSSPDIASLFVCRNLWMANKLLLHQTILKPIWTYGIPLWGTVCHSNIQILQRFQTKVLRTSANAPRYIPNSLLHTDIQMSTVRDEIMKFSTNCRAKLFTHPIERASVLLVEPDPRRLKRFRPTDLPTRYS
jgi:hypothetical protein